ncbi:MAG: replication-associated recombination protein A [Clostridiales bacterium]|nr:replication-associated recombination protein A [Clostridiales bacterium]
MMPTNLDEYVGQEHILAKDKILYRTIKADRLSSIILWGPPGCGKTSLAKVISNTTKYKFVKLNAVTAGVSDIKHAIEDSNVSMFNMSGKVVLFIDEIHRFNKLQQDALLPYVENGKVILIGATTENPYFEVNKALISRSMVFQLHQLSNENVFTVLKRAIISEKGLASFNIEISDGTLKKIAASSNGDVRTALNALEIAVLTTAPNATGVIKITDEIAKECVVDNKIMFDKDGDSHYDNISAFIKSMRGSDPDAAVFYLARAIYAGEDPVFLARRICILAAEDVGMADPMALVVANSALQVVKAIGMPEGRIVLSEAAIYMANAPKSNASYNAINSALSDVENVDTGIIPMHIRNAPVKGMEKEGYHVGYKYPHDYHNHLVDQQYLPDKIKDVKYYLPDENCINSFKDEVKNKNSQDN